MLDYLPTVKHPINLKSNTMKNTQQR